MSETINSEVNAEMNAVINEAEINGEINKDNNAACKNVLLSFVGNHDPWNYKGALEDRPMDWPDEKDEGPILGLCRLLEGENRIDALYMLSLIHI